MSVAEPSVATPTAPGLVSVTHRALDRARNSPAGVAMRAKDHGIWREYTWRETWDLIETVAHAYLALGVDVGDRVSIHAEDRPEWVIADLAAVAVRGITVGLYPTNPSAEVAYALGDSTPTLHIAEDQEQVDKVLEIEGGAPGSVAKIIHIETRGLSDYGDARLMSWDSLLELGRQHRNEFPDAVERRMAEATDDDVMTIVYTSGTTGPPKGAMLTNRNAGFAIETIVNAGERMDGPPPNEKDLILTYLPLCHVAERVFSTWTMVGSGPVLNFAESIETVNINLMEVQPTLFFAVPRIWEKLHAGVLIKANDAPRLKKFALGLGLKAGAAIGRQVAANGGRHTLMSRLLYALAFPIVLRPLKARLGLRRCRYAASGAAPIAPEVLEFFMGIGVPVHELYGMTENSAVATANFAGRIKLGTVGEPYDTVELRLDPDTGEIQTRHPGTFAGYWNKPEATAETMTDDGFLKTGDVGEWVDGTHLKIIDRIKHIIITAGGKNISPSEIENALKASPFVNEAMVIGDGRKFISALIGIEYDTVGDWALRRQLSYTTYGDLAAKPEVIELIEGVVAKTNERFARVEHVRAFRLLPRELDHEDGDMTATQKIKREALAASFSDLIEEMYA